MYAWMIERDYPKDEALRVADAIVATTAQKSQDGVVQTHVRQGRKDPLKLIVAMADIQATTMEGDTRMLKDATKLYFEINPPHSKTIAQHTEGLSAFLANQHSFVSDRLDSVRDDLRYYFPEEIAIAIESKLRDEFRTKGLSVVHTARDLRSTTTTLIDSLRLSIDTLPSSPIQASRIAQNALFKAVNHLRKQ